MSATSSRGERSIHHIARTSGEEPFHRASFSVGNRIARFLWQCVYFILYRPSPRPFHLWRAWLLGVFGAKLGPGCHFYPGGKIWAPWNLICEDCCTLADGAEIYNPSPIHLGSHCTISQQAFICGATHDHNDPEFPMISYRMNIGAYAWICARASVSPGVAVGEGAVLGLGSVAIDDLEPWSVYVGVPAAKVKARAKFKI